MRPDEPTLDITKASGALFWDSMGNPYIDGTSMAWSDNMGASVPEVVEAAFEQARKLSHLRSSFDLADTVSAELQSSGKGAWEDVATGEKWEAAALALDPLSGQDRRAG